jgi:hypothetical protein
MFHLSPCGSVSDGAFQVADDFHVVFAFGDSSVGRSDMEGCSGGSVGCMPDCLAPVTQLMKVASGNDGRRNVDFGAVSRI